MARKLRLEYAGAMYHVINRGNYRADIFGSEGAKEAFEECLFEACAKARWRLHAFVVMRNHYHLALETPEANLVEGMRWLQSTYANRFNRFRDERGHVFQGRYHAFLVEDLNRLGAVGHYIHLNPVRAKLCDVQRLVGYRHSSYLHLRRPKKRPKGLTFEAVLASAGRLTDSNMGWRSYAAYLEWLAEDKAAQKALAFDRMCRGWALGSEEFKQDLLKEYQEKVTAAQLGDEAGAEIRPLQWQSALEAAMRRLRKTVEHARKDAKSAPWKIAVAAHLKATTTASNPWLAKVLHMGAPATLSRYVAECRSGRRPATHRYRAKISKSKV